MLQCTSPCPDPENELGAVLYTGAYNPVFPSPTTPDHTPQQNFTVTVPSFSGQVQLAAIVYSLVGVSADLVVFYFFVVRCTNKVTRPPGRAELDIPGSAERAPHGAVKTHGLTCKQSPRGKSSVVRTLIPAHLETIRLSYMDQIHGLNSCLQTVLF